MAARWGAGALALLLLASPAVQAERGTDTLWTDTQADRPAAAVPAPALPQPQVGRLVVADPRLPTFDLRGARQVIQLAQLPPGAETPKGEGWLTNLKRLDASDLAQESAEPIGESEVEELDISDFGDGASGEAAGGSDIDPLEAINRPIFEMNLFLDRWILRPVTRVYIETVPEPGRDGVSNFLQNLRTPVILANDLLQGEMSRAGATFGRFFINTFFGLAGLVDTASALGLPGHEEDMGQTLGSYGIGGKPYLMLPFFGPSNPRDAIGKVGDIMIDPLSYLTPEELSQYETGINLVNDRANVIDETDSLESTSIDFYSAVRSFYYQNRDYEISNGRAVAPKPVELRNGGTDSEDLYGDLDSEELEGLEQDLQIQ